MDILLNGNRCQPYWSVWKMDDLWLAGPVRELQRFDIRPSDILLHLKL